MSKIQLIEDRIARDADLLAKLDERRVVLVDRIQAAEGELITARLLDTVGVGSRIKFNVGRGETRREVEGVVIARAEGGEDRRLKVQFGEGFDIEVAVIQPAHITQVFVEDGAETTEATQGEEQV